MNHRVMIFIDGSNLDLSVKRFRQETQNYQLDYIKLCEFLVRGRILQQAHYFGSEHYPLNSSRTNFHHLLTQHNFSIHTFPRKTNEKEVDVALAVEIVDHCNKDNYDVAILVSGDRDFKPAIDKVRLLKKRVEVASFRKSLSRDLQRACDDTIILDTFADVYRKV